MEEEAVRGSIKVSKGAEKGASRNSSGRLSARRVLRCTVQDIRAQNADAAPDEIQHILDEAVSEVRAERRAKQQADEA
jgi:hypothetical protein